MTTNTQINITAKDSTAAAFASANNNLANLVSSALKTTAGLAGIGLSIAGAVDAVKGIAQATIQFQQFNSTLLIGTGSAKGAADALAFVRSESQRLGLDLANAASQFAKLSAATMNTALEGKKTEELFSSLAAASAVLGLSTEKTERTLNAFQQMISKGRVQREELVGQLGDSIPGAFQIAARAMGKTTEELDKFMQAGKLLSDDFVPKITAEFDKMFGAQAEQSAKGLNAQINRMNTAIFNLKLAIGESGLINFLSSGIELATKLGNALTSAFGGGQKLSPIEKQVSLIKTLEEELESLQNLTNIPLIGDLLFDKKQADLLKFRIESATEDLGKMKARLAAESGGETVISTATKQAETLSVVTKKTISDAERFIAALQKEAETVGLTAIETKRLEAAKLGVLNVADPLINKIDQVTQEMDAQKAAASSLASDLKKIESITESVKTEEEKLIDTQTELNRLLGSGLSVETYNRAMEKAQNETKGLEKQTKKTTDQVDQLWTQAGRNIQSTLANSIFNFFDDGLKGMLKNVISTVGRIGSEFAALKIAQGVGLGSIFGGMSGAANASGGGGGISTLLSGASLASGAASLFGSGFGATSALSSVGGMLPGSAGAFFGGMGGGAVTGVSSQAALMGAKVASFAGPAIAIAAVDQITRMLVGDKQLGGTVGKVLNFVPILGPLINGLFGRGPMKQGMTTLKGSLGAEGFESGRLQTRFDAKGGAFRSNKTDFATVDAATGKVSTDNGKLNAYAQGLANTSTQIIGLINDTTKQVSASLYQMGENLGLSTDGLDNFSHTIKLVSKAGKGLTEEQIGNEIAAITEELARSLIPTIDDLKKSGETTTQALTRLSVEFSSLENAAMNLGASSKYANELIKGMSFEARTSLVELAGGIESLSSKTAFFAQNFLTESERLIPITENLKAGLESIGLSASITREQFKALIQDINTSNETRNKLLDLAPAFLAVDSAAAALVVTTTELVEAELDLTDVRSHLLTAYQDERGELESTISTFKNVSKTIGEFRRGLLLSGSSPLTPGQKLDEARSQLDQMRIAAFSGDQDAIAKLPSIAQDFLDASRIYNASGDAYLNDFSMIQDMFKNGEIAALSQVDIATNQLGALDASVKNLIDINENTKSTNDLIREISIAVLTGKGNSEISTSDIQGFLGANQGMSPYDIATNAANFGVSLDQLSSAGYDTSNIIALDKGKNITDQQIRDFAEQNKSDPMAMYQAAIENGINSARVASATGWPLPEIEKFVKDNGLKSFAGGTDFISRSGLAMVHRAEAIVPSSTTGEIKKLREELSKLREEQNRQTGDLIRVIDITNRQNADIIAKSNREISKDQQWVDRSKAALA